MTLPVTPAQNKIEVLHLCEDARQLNDLIDLQIGAGIRPYLLTNPSTAGRWWTRAWSDVREWRRLLTGFSIPLIHAHTFAAGMAAVRGDAAAVYQYDNFVERQLATMGSTWMQRSFRAAEHFVLSQAHAVIVPSAAMRHTLTTGGIAATNIFVIPKPAPVFAAPQSPLPELPPHSEAHLTVVCETTNSAVRKAIAACATTAPDRLRFLARAPGEGSFPPGCETLPEPAFEAARHHAAIVIAAEEAQAAEAMAAGAAVLAADTLFMRELSPQGEGCLWFGNGEELASKLVFLVSNPEFRSALAQAGRRYILKERSPERIGKAYVKAYQHALERRKNRSGPVDFSTSLIPARVV